jgi:hypothetical protein
MGAALLACGLVRPPLAHGEGKWIELAHLAPDYIGTMLLLSDGTVIGNNGASNWYRLTPDSTGGYTNGSWSTNIAIMHYPRLYFASQVLTNGQVFIAGGEYSTNNGGGTAEVYNPLNNRWTLAPSTPAPVQFLDSISDMLPDGNVLVAPVDPSANGGTLIWNTASSTWSVGPTLYRWGDQSEASWVKLPDNSILTVDALGDGSAPGTTSERYIPSINQWIPDMNLQVQLWANLLPYYVGEGGPAFLLPNGKAFFLGGSGATALYTPSGNTNQGSWQAGPSIPGSYVAADAPGAMMVNGKVLCAVAPAPYFTQVTNLNFPSPTYFYEYNYSTGSTGAFTQIHAPNGSYTNSGPTYVTRLLDLPDGTVLFSLNGNYFYDYVPDGSPLAAGQPNIYGVSYTPGGALLITGALFNGISEGAGYGDDAQMDSNYPLVRFTSGGKVYYGRTFNWNTTGVMTGSQVVSTECTVPTNLPPGSCSMSVIANGIASSPVSFYGPVWVDFNYTGGTQNGTHQYPYKTLAQGVSAVASGGTIFVNGSVQPSISSETPTLTKAMTIVSVGGSSTIGE